MNLKKAGYILRVGSVDAYFLSTYTETGSDALYNWQCCSCQAVLALLICLGTYGHKHLTYHHHHEIFPFKRVYWLILLLPVQSFLFFLGFWSLIKRIGSNSDRVSFLFPSFFSTFHEEHHVVHCFVTFPFIQHAQMNLSFWCLNQNSSKTMEKFLIPSAAGPHKLGTGYSKALCLLYNYLKACKVREKLSVTLMEYQGFTAPLHSCKWVRKLKKSVLLGKITLIIWSSCWA